MRLNSKDIGYKKPEPIVEKPLEIKTEVFDDSALLVKVETLIRKYTLPLQTAIRDCIPEEKEDTPKSYSCEVIRDNDSFIKEIKIKEV